MNHNVLKESRERKTQYTSKDFSSDQDVRWCPGCGDYSILKQTQTVLADLDIPKENIVFISGIGCSSRFPYYMNTYGIHSIHGRAPAIATGLKVTRPELSVWMITGDGDALSIGGNHLIHILRRNLDTQILLFNNEIYGLTKGQYSPTSEPGLITNSSPYGSIDYPFNPLSVAFGAEGTFIARTIDRDAKHLKEILYRSHSHRGTAFVEIYQNCPVFNDGAFSVFTDKDKKVFHAVFLQHGQPMKFGPENELGLILEDGYRPKVVNLKQGEVSENDLWIHDEHDKYKASILVRLFDDPSKEDAIPRPFGILYSANRPTYEDLIWNQIEEITNIHGKGKISELLRGEESWTIE
jgi:2-oxoglutarate ferredoxin oxidoreductase subunit beta